jgi:hypothetical protein
MTPRWNWTINIMTSLSLDDIEEMVIDEDEEDS